MTPPDDAGSKTPATVKPASRSPGGNEPGKPPAAEIDYDAVADEVIRTYPKILARLAE